MHFIMVVITLKFTYDMSITYTTSLRKTIRIPSYIISIYFIHWTVSRKPHRRRRVGAGGAQAPPIIW